MDGSLVSDAPVEGTAPGLRGWLALAPARLRSALFGKDSLAVLDQVVVSGTSFLTSILIWRWCGPGEFGVYSLGFTLLVMWGCVQESLIAMPYTIFRHRPILGTPAEYAGSVLVQQMMLSALAAVLLAVGGLVYPFLPINHGSLGDLSGVIWALAAVIPFTLMREFGRRFAFAHLGMFEAFALDAAVSVLQLGGLAVLARAGGLNGMTAFAALGVACAATTGFWLYKSRGQFVVHGGQWRKTIRPSWDLGKWVFASQLIFFVQAYFLHWLLFWSSGPVATGIYAACMSIAQFSNPLILGIGNALAPRTAHAFATGGGAELRRVVFQTTLLLATAMAAFCLVVFVGGDWLMAFLYRGSQYTGHDDALAVLALAMLATAVGLPASNALTAIERADVGFKVGAVTVALSVVLCPILVAWWGVTGAAYGFLIGNVFATAGRWLVFAVVVGKRGTPTHPIAVTRVLQQFVPGSGEEGWVIEPLNEGEQASIFTAKRGDQTPAWQDQGDLVVKMYKPEARIEPAAVREQFEQMARFHADLDGRSAAGWSVRAPAPLYQCDRPFALVMTRVPGKSLNAFLRSVTSADEGVLAEIADAVVAGMEGTWAVKAEVHGDFNFDNILCDPAGRTLSFVDPGVQPREFLTDDAPRHFYPASRDLAHLLFETEVTFRKTLTSPAVRRRQHVLVEEIVRAYLRRAVPVEGHADLLDEVHACARCYLENVRPAWTARGLWRRIVRGVAGRRIDELLARLRREIPTDESSERASRRKPDLRRRHVELTHRRSPAPFLAGILDSLDRAGVAYCLPHGLPRSDTADVDLVVPADIGSHGVAGVVRDCGFDVVRSLSGHVVVVGRPAEGSRTFVDLDVSTDYSPAGRRFYSADEILSGRQRADGYYHPPAAIAFGCLLTRRVAKAEFGCEHEQRLSDLFRQDVQGCRKQIDRFWGTESAAILAVAAETGNWTGVRGDLRRLRAELFRRATLRQPARVVGRWLARQFRRLRRYVNPAGGVGVIFLGPDGAGKSTVIDEVRRQLAGAFAASTVLQFPPALLRKALGRAEGPVQLPHALPRRSRMSSVVRAVGYWFVYYTLGYWLLVRPALARSTLVLHDRHLLDAVVDPTRYRYSGPRWLPRLIWRLVPKADLVILLDAPAEVLQGRKQEVPLDVTVRQREQYRKLVGGLNNGHVVSTARSLGEVIDEVTAFILGELRRRGRP